MHTDIEPTTSSTQHADTSANNLTATAPGQLRVIKRNGTVVRKLGTQAEPSRDSIRVDGKRIKLAAEPVYLALNKPAGFITTLNDPQQRPDITRFLEPLGEKQRVFPVGRLDFNSSGLR